MKILLRPLGEWVIGLRSNIFIKSRIKLTLVYIIITLFILIFFSYLLYTNYSREVEGDFEGDISDKEQLVLAQRSLERLRIQIVMVSGITLGLVGIVSFILSGITLKPIKENMERERKFISDVAHELRTPLAIMKTELEVSLKDPKINKKQLLSVLQSNLEEVERLTKLAEDLLYIFRLEINEVDSNLERISIKDISEKVIKLMTPYAKKKEIDIELQTSEDLYILGNPEEIRRILFNLIKNAIDYNKYKGKVKVRFIKDNKYLVLEIEDTGIGIPKDEIPLIFNRFYRVDKSRSSQIQGTGLGLSIVKGIVDKYNGKIIVESKLGEGTIFKILLPI
ncbi:MULTISPECIES: sensor histidine kinase [Dictyoglomus]|uniref:sensor histidine kinase n=1 Tax=Dictyoglomus TaxID=13 RepID=UPI00235327FD|nr:HAMP domain-containing sensor histidine kinase [Dictyoglomus turgidum]